jgi:hypothetical protein
VYAGRLLEFHSARAAVKSFRRPYHHRHSHASGHRLVRRIPAKHGLVQQQTEADLFQFLRKVQRCFPPDRVPWDVPQYSLINETVVVNETVVGGQDHSAVRCPRSARSSPRPGSSELSGFRAQEPGAVVQGCPTSGSESPPGPARPLADRLGRTFLFSTSRGAAREDRQNRRAVCPGKDRLADWTENNGRAGACQINYF